MKKLTALILVLALLCSTAACTKRPEESPELPQPGDSISAPAEGKEEQPGPAAPAEPRQPQTPAPDAPEEPGESPAPDAAEEPEESPEPMEEPQEEPEESPEPTEKPVEDSANEGKLDSSAAVASTATDLAPADSAYLSLIPELPYEGWASTTVSDSSILLELSPAPGDAQSKLLEYIESLRDKDFDITEYIYGSLYDAVNDKVSVSIMLEGGKLSIIIEKL